MPFLFVAKSKALAEWGADVGLGKSLFRLGYSEEDPANLIKAANWGGMSDWALIKKEEVPEGEEETFVTALERKEKLVDPNFYPKLRGLRGIFKVKPENVENHLMLARALEGFNEITIKLKPLDIATYLIANARKGG